MKLFGARKTPVATPMAEPEPPAGPDLSPQALALTLLEQGDAYVYVMDRELRYLYLNQKALDDAYHGLSLEQVIGKTGRDFFPSGVDSSDLDDLEYHDRYVIHTRKPIQVYEMLMGRILYSNKWPLYDDDDQVYAVAGISFDVTDVVEERVRGEGKDAELLVNMMNSTSRMTRALMRMQNSL